MRSRILAPLAALALTLGAASAAGAATTITSTFDSGDDGWRFGHPNISPQSVGWDATNQRLTRTHAAAAWGFIASDAYLGDKSAYIGGSLSFELSAAGADLERPLLVLVGTNGQTIYSNWGPSPGEELSAFDVTLSASNFYGGSVSNVAGAVTDAEFAAIMGSLKVMQIFGDWASGRDVVGLDNVALSAAGVGAIPEPATWAMMILGFGTAGTMLRRRRARSVIVA